MSKGESQVIAVASDDGHSILYYLCKLCGVDHSFRFETEARALVHLARYEKNNLVHGPRSKLEDNDYRIVITHTSGYIHERRCRVVHVPSPEHGPIKSTRYYCHHCPYEAARLPFVQNHIRRTHNIRARQGATCQPVQPSPPIPSPSPAASPTAVVKIEDPGQVSRHGWSDSGIPGSPTPSNSNTEGSQMLLYNPTSRDATDRSDFRPRAQSGGHVPDSRLSIESTGLIARAEPKPRNRRTLLCDGILNDPIRFPHRFWRPTVVCGSLWTPGEKSRLLDAVQCWANLPKPLTAGHADLRRAYLLFLSRSLPSKSASEIRVYLEQLGLLDSTIDRTARSDHSSRSSEPSSAATRNQIGDIFFQYELPLSDQDVNKVLEVIDVQAALRLARKHAPADEYPAVYRNTIVEMYDSLVRWLPRLMKAALGLASERYHVGLRQGNPAKRVEREDIIEAFKLLNPHSMQYLRPFDAVEQPGQPELNTARSLEETDEPKDSDASMDSDDVCESDGSNNSYGTYDSQETESTSDSDD
ncbi:uncharacterized protein BJ171DRAFT_198799 [Polychytrium aggregatum]|uniref:uncharacterized protein n=1 Tax=Polychytrium aggregatum TaxID=110093 RepID=UPI0022FF188A|nr:uncharacterized protein BJ171DRAFT_198799 [Polychytrium aggregatum]KAI9199795.1 hypothetical protein BJ171DRAFT_198799 [Polychytrium aggregatum]